MTSPVVSNENCFARLAWSGGETSFNPSFNALEKAHVVVKYETAAGVIGSALTLDTHYSLTLGANNAVTLVPISLPAAPGFVRIERVTPAVMTTQFADLGGYSADVHTLLHTAAAMRAAENRRKISVQQTTLDALADLEEDLEAAVTAAGASATAAEGSLSSITALLLQSTIMYFADGVPSNALGKNGDVYVQKDSSTWLIYGPKAAGAWGASVGELKPVAGNVSEASNAAASNRLMRSAGADKTIKDSSISVADDGTMTGVRFNTPTQSYEPATKAFAEGLFLTNDALLLKGAIDCSANPNYPAGDAGHVYKVSAAGKIGGGSGPNVEVGDTLYCFTDGSSAGTHAAVGANWWIQQANIDSPLKVADIGSTVQGYDANTTKNNANNVFTGLNTIQSVKEKVTRDTTTGGPASTAHFDVLTQAVLYFTANCANNWTLNVRGNSGTTLDSLMSNDQSITIEVIATNGGTAYRQTAMTIDGNAVTPQWLGAAAPGAGTINKRDTYTFQIIKTAGATFIVQATFAAGN